MMDQLMKLSRDSQIILGGALLYVILSFLDWQQVCASGGGISVCAGRSEWNGIGVIGALLGLALLAWEIVRVLGLKIELGSLSPALISVGLAVALLVFTVITFLSHGTARHWPQWIALAVSIILAIVAVRRGRGEGVEMPTMASLGAVGGSKGSGGGAAVASSGAGPTTSAGDSSSAPAGTDEGGEPPPPA